MPPSILFPIYPVCHQIHFQICIFSPWFSSPPPSLTWPIASPLLCLTTTARSPHSVRAELYKQNSDRVVSCWKPLDGIPFECRLLSRSVVPICMPTTHFRLKKKRLCWRTSAPHQSPNIGRLWSWKTGKKHILAGIARTEPVQGC